MRSLYFFHSSDYIPFPNRFSALVSLKHAVVNHISFLFLFLFLFSFFRGHCLPKSGRFIPFLPTFSIPIRPIPLFVVVVVVVVVVQPKPEFTSNQVYGYVPSSTAVNISLVSNDFLIKSRYRRFCPPPPFFFSFWIFLFLFSFGALLVLFTWNQTLLQLLPFAAAPRLSGEPQKTLPSSGRGRRLHPC